MTDKEITNELNKIPKDDVEKINSIQGLSDEEITRVAGGLSPTTKKVIKYLSITGAFTAAIGVSAAVGHKLGRSKGELEGESVGLNKGIVVGKSQGEEETMKNMGKIIKANRKNASIQGYNIGLMRGLAQTNLSPQEKDALKRQIELLDNIQAIVDRMGLEQQQ